MVRGVAVMGILLLNVVGFAMPEAAYTNPRAFGGWHGADLGVWLTNFVLFDGKMRALFSFLFGASMLLVIERAEASGRDPARVHYLRMLWLLAFGLAHLWLIWDGDILAQYAVIGMIAFAARDLPVVRLVTLGAMLVAFDLVTTAQLPLAIFQHQCCASSPEQAAEYARDLAGWARTLGTPPPHEIAQSIAVHQGGWIDLVRHRLMENPAGPLPSLLFSGAETLAYMLFGMAGLRSGMLAGAWEPARYRRWLWISWGIALPAYAALAFYLVWTQFSLFSVGLAIALAVPVRPVMAIGWACLILLLTRNGGALTGRIAAAGRMAFTNYLATSLICTTLFYGYGLGWFGSLSRWQLYPIVFGIWALMLLWSKPWLARFRFGPLEWMWRSLARGRLELIRGGATN
ncbi:MAG: DUF418 domain-containing protein [Sphingomonadales bacterium]|nr:MAG: DUF418 domain-containing protein [Sphingomonadales bacterium]